MIIHIVDDEDAILDAMRFLLAPLQTEICTWRSSRDFIQQADLYRQGVVLLDMRMPLLDGHQVHQLLREKQSVLAVVIMTAHGDIPMAVQELKLGALDFLAKPVAFESLQRVISQGREFSRKQLEIHRTRRNYQKLTEKEKRLLEHILQGTPNKLIADKLAVSVRTVEVHRANIMEKMQAESLAALVSAITLLKEYDRAD
ncbi:LuxR family two component transcriptional regulator [Mesocricetibacter intestinalis]|uniref:LuxR family two component transcriptional regulator n=1 Tax=Mesocricetibacter intestinalis TaxID=1521930 RepID=A0A4R6VCK5_9PAST|nr:response regulator [Mesocricetibacter intestinalis]TDQ57965.1 LuxR family two component transcriptional regulator [Mesocricetibacter intestinalis]